MPLLASTRRGHSALDVRSPARLAGPAPRSTRQHHPVARFLAARSAAWYLGRSPPGSVRVILVGLFAMRVAIWRLPDHCEGDQIRLVGGKTS